MNISGIDKDFVDIINYLDQKGFKPFASCDGVLSNHADPEMVTSAYIAFLKSPQILDLMAAFLRDKDIFEVSLSSDSDAKPFEMYGNLIEGNRYSVSFFNKTGNITSYFEKIIKGVVEGTITIADDEKQDISMLSDILEEDENSDLCFDVIFNSRYQPYMQKQGRTNVMIIRTKDGYGYARNMSDLADILAKKYGIAKKKMDWQEEFPESEFVVNYWGNDICEIYFTDEHIGQMIEQIRFMREIAPTLPTFEIRDVDDYDFDEDEYDSNGDEEPDID